MKRLKRAILRVMAAALLKRVRLRLRDRTRQTTKEYVRGAVTAELRELLLVAMPDSRIETEADTTSVLDGVDDQDRSDVLRLVLISGAVVAILAGSALAFLAARRMRRRVRPAESIETSTQPASADEDEPSMPRGAAPGEAR